MLASLCTSLKMESGRDATPGSHIDYQQLFTAVILQQSSPSAVHLQVRGHALAHPQPKQQAALVCCVWAVVSIKTMHCLTHGFWQACA
jgi:hypothetical protein